MMDEPPRKPAAPNRPGWDKIATGVLPDGQPFEAWQHGRTCVVSSVDGRERHVSISVIGHDLQQRPPGSLAAREALRAFDMDGAEENKINAERARHFFKA